MNIEQLAAWTRLKSKSALFALIGLIISPLAVVAHAPVSSAESVHSYVPFDYEEWRREHPRPAGKRLADRNRGEERTVRMIYFLPNDRSYRQEIVDKMKAMMRRVQTFFAEQMQAHGYGNTTFRFETDVQGEPLVHRVDGQHPVRHYKNYTNRELMNHELIVKVLDEIYFGEGPLQFDVMANDYLIVIDGYNPAFNQDYGKRGGISFVPDFNNELADDSTYFRMIAHELGHTFGLYHDFRDGAYIMSYGNNSDRLSACHAELLSVHPYFNADISLGGEMSLNEDYILQGGGRDQSSIEIISSPYYPARSTSVSIRLKVSDAEGLHQVSLYDVARELTDGGRGKGLRECRGLSGEKEAVVEFEYDVSIPPFGLDPSEIELHRLFGYVVDADGEKTQWNLNITEASPYNAATFELGGWVDMLSFSLDGALLAVATQGQVQLWDVASRQQITPFEVGGWIPSLSFSLDGALLAVATQGQVQLWDVASKQQITSFKLGSRVYVVSFLPDGILAAGGGEWNAEEWYETFKLWDVATRQHITTLVVNRSNSSTRAVSSFSPDGALLAVATQDQVQLWDVASRQQIASFKPRGGWVDMLSFSPDGALLAVATEDLDQVQLWDVASRQQITPFEVGDWISSLSFSPDGALLAVATQGQVQLWDIANRQQIATFVYPDAIRSLSFSPDGALLAAGGQHNRVQLWDVSEWAGSSGQAVTDDDVKKETTDDEAIPQTLTKVSGDGQGGQVGERLAKPFVVSVLDQNGSAFAGAVVTFSVTAGGGTLSATTAATDASGRARTTLTLGPDPGTNTVAATVAGLGTVTFTATATGQILHSLTKVSGDGQQGTVGERLSKPFVVSVLDQNGSAFAGAVVTFSVTAGGGTLSATTDTTDADGRAATRLTLGSDEETNTVTATVEGLAAVTFTATAITPHSLTKVSGDGQQGPVSTQLAKPFVVLVLDEEDKAMAGVVVTFTVTSGGGTMSSNTAITSTYGRAARTLTLGDEPGTNTVEVSVAGLDPVTFTATAIGEELSLDLSDLFNQSGKLAVLPDHTQLLQNAPNPFNSQTVVSYFLLEPGPVRLEVFALSGQRIAVLHQGPQQAGYHRLHWDGRDTAGHSVASGTYLYRLVADEVVLTRKLVLLR